MKKMIALFLTFGSLSSFGQAYEAHNIVYDVNPANYTGFNPYKMTAKERLEHANESAIDNRTTRGSLSSYIRSKVSGKYDVVVSHTYTWDWSTWSVTVEKLKGTIQRDDFGRTVYPSDVVGQVICSGEVSGDWLNLYDCDFSGEWSRSDIRVFPRSVRL